MYLGTCGHESRGYLGGLKRLGWSTTTTTTTTPTRGGAGQGCFLLRALLKYYFAFCPHAHAHMHTHAHYAKGRRTKKRLNSCGIIVQSLNQKQRCQLRFSSLRFDSSSSSSSDFLPRWTSCSEQCSARKSIPPPPHSPLSSLVQSQSRKKKRRSTFRCSRHIIFVHEKKG